MNTFQDFVLVCSDKSQHEQIEIARFAKMDILATFEDWANYQLVLERSRKSDQKTNTKQVVEPSEGHKPWGFRCPKCRRSPRISAENLQNLAISFMAQKRFKLDISNLTS